MVALATACGPPAPDPPRTDTPGVPVVITTAVERPMPVQVEYPACVLLMVEAAIAHEKKRSPKAS